MIVVSQFFTMKIKNILVTGGSGYIGSMLVTKLVMMGHNVGVIDINKYAKNSLLHLYSYTNFKFILGDVRDQKLIKKYLNKYEYIIPLAALVGAPLCEKNKNEAIQTNLNSIKMLVENLKVDKKLIYLTTNSGYGIGSKQKFCTEKSKLNPISLYGVTKVDAEKIVMKRKNSVSLRLATVFGYSFRMRTDLLVNNFVHTAIKNKKLDLYESNFRRNFIHIQDVVNGIIFIINNFHKCKNEVYNLGLSSANINKLELAKKIKKVIKDLKIRKIKNKKDPDKRDYFVSNKKIEKKGFKAKITLEEGIKELKNIYIINEIKVKNNY